MKKYLTYAFYILLPLAVGGIVSLIISGNIDYSSLNKPPLSPPGVLFPIVWTILYILMGIAFFLYKRNGNTSKETDKTYYLQLLVNALWSIIFFLFKWRFFAIIWTLLLVYLIYALLKKIKRKNLNSYYLLIPYFIWTIFATYLTIGVFILN